LSGLNAVDVGEKAVDDSRRYDQLVDMMAHFNADFDERKYWTYGCHCLMLGDRPMSDMGHGVPLDPIDKACKDYKECQKCARDQYGDSCLGEFYRYSYGYNNDGSVRCNDDPGRNAEKACKRKLCECDAMFAEAHAGVKDLWNKDYHGFWSEPLFEPDTACITPPGNRDPQCCGLKTEASVIFNANRNECCDGNLASLKPIGSC